MIQFVKDFVFAYHIFSVHMSFYIRCRQSLKSAVVIRRSRITGQHITVSGGQIRLKEF